MLKKILYLLTVIILFQTNSFSQFGQNKVQYKTFDWYYIQTNHFDIYFDEQGDALAEFTAYAAEDALEKILDSFNYNINNRITIIVYNSQNDFQETNVTDSYLSEGIQGFTELFKNRVVVQFTGSYKALRHLIHHELSHAVINDMFYGGSLQNIISNNITLQLPLWFNEGLAEYQALGWNIEEDMFIRDAAIGEYLPDISQLTGFFAYRGGQAVFYYIAKKYGKEKIGELIHKLKGVGNINEAFKQTLGLSIKEFNERWRKDIKRTYWPDIEVMFDPDEYAKRLTDPEEDDGYYNTGPALSPKGDKVAFITNRDFFFSLYLMDAHTGEIIKELAEGNIAPDFEELNIIAPGLTWSPDGKTLAISALSHGYDLIYLLDVENEEFTTISLDLDAINGLSWSWDGKSLAFVGQTPRQSDIYVYNLETEELKNLTDDIFSDSDPEWNHKGDEIYFISDRSNYLTKDSVPEGFKINKHNYKQTDIYVVNVNTLKVGRITDLPNSDESFPVVSEDDKEILFISDMSGIKNIYKKRIVFSRSDENISSITEVKSVPVTNSQSGLYHLSASQDGKKIVFTSLYNRSYNIFLMNNPFEYDLELDSLPLTKFRKGLFDISRSTEVVSQHKDEEQTDESETDINVDSPFFTGNVIDTSSVYGDSIQVDYGNYVFGGKNEINKPAKDSANIAFNPTDNLDEDGNFLVNKYKVTFGPDLIYANAGYNTLYGFVGTTVISFSDVLGNHRLIGITGLQIDLKNSDYGLAYFYLAKRINWGIQGFHTARFINLLRGNRVELIRYRNFGLVGTASYPLNRFYRFELGVSWLNIKSENLVTIAEEPESVSLVVPSISFVHDNILWGYTAPIEGTRYRVDVLGNLGFDDPKLSFVSLLGDYRTYFRFFTDHSLALRFSGGFSDGNNPQRFFIGGIDNWINRSYATTEVPIESVSDFAFLSAALPLRGYNYAEQIGTRYALMNIELRFPLIRYLVTGGLPILLSNVQGVAFIDIGTAWSKNSELSLFKRDRFGNLVTDDLLVGTGVGARVFFLYFLLRFDMAWAYNIEGFSSPKFYFSIGADF
ncbi:MAG: PD40 domain-containing protein [Bacteroidetes bacterium]|nr:PD40 domain-containing protein [Bacteroidota bacterium]